MGFVPGPVALVSGRVGFVSGTVVLVSDLMVPVTGAVPGSVRAPLLIRVSSGVGRRIGGMSLLGTARTYIMVRTIVIAVRVAIHRQ